MKRILIKGLLILLISATAVAQTGPASQTRNAFAIDTKAGTFGFRLPYAAQAHDIIFFTHGNGVVVKKVEIDQEMLRLGKYTFANSSLPPGDYVVTVISNAQIRYSFNFHNKVPVTTQIIKDSKLMSASFSGSQALTFDPRTHEFIINTDIAFSEGNKIEVYDAQHTLVASQAVSADMIAAKEYAVKALQLQNGIFSVSIDGVEFGSVEYME